MSSRKKPRRGLVGWMAFVTGVIGKTDMKWSRIYAGLTSEQPRRDECLLFGL